MRGSTRWILLAVVLGSLAMFAALRAFVVVDETEFVLVTSFGRRVSLYGASPGDAGLHLKWPWQTARAIDRRLQVSGPPAREVITGDKKNLEVASFVVWRVTGPDRFLRAAGTIEAAGARLDERVTAALGTAIGRHNFDELVSADRDSAGLDLLTEEVLADLVPAIRAELGIELIDARLRRFNFPLEVRPAVFELIRSERQQVAARLRADGEAQYRTITSQAERERDAILAKADAEAERIRGQAEAETARVLGKAHSQGPEFATFLRTLETYRAMLDDRATLVLSASSPLLKLLTQGPPEEAGPPRIDGNTPLRTDP